MTTINVWFTLPTKDLKGYEGVKLPVRMNIPDNNEVNGDIEYSVTMPDYIFDELADTEPQFKTTYNQNNKPINGMFSHRSVRNKFKKTQTSKLISQLQDYFISITQFINDKHSIETETMKKKIFIKFTHLQSHTRNELNAAYMGEQISQNFKYFIGYEVMTDKFSGLNRNISKKYITKILYQPQGASLHKLDTGFKEKDDLFLPLNSQYESTPEFEGKYSIIDWSEDRENFCEQIKQKFMEVNKNLSSFLSNIDDNKFDALMQDFTNKMLTQ